MSSPKTAAEPGPTHDHPGLAAPNVGITPNFLRDPPRPTPHRRTGRGASGGPARHARDISDLEQALPKMHQVLN